MTYFRAFAFLALSLLFISLAVDQLNAQGKVPPKAEKVSRPEDLSADMLREIVQSQIIGRIEKFEVLMPRWAYELDRTTSQDLAHREVEVTLKPTPDGAREKFKALVLYQHDRGSSTPWYFREVKQSTRSEFIGGQTASSEILREQTLDSIRKDVRKWFSPASNVYRVRKVLIPADPNFRRLDGKETTWNAVLVFDQKAGYTKIRTIERTVLVSRKPDPQGNFFSPGPESLGEKILSESEFSSAEIRKLPSLADTPFDKLFVDAPLTPSTAPPAKTSGSQGRPTGRP